MTTESKIRESLREWIAGASGNTTPERLSDDTPLFRSGVLKSVQVSDLILYIEELAERAVDVEQLKPGAFRDIDTIYSIFFAGTHA